MKPAQPLNLVFDLGGVLLDWRPADLLQMTFPDAVHCLQDAAELAPKVFAHPDWLAFDQGVLSAAELAHRTADRLALDAFALAGLIDSIGSRLQPLTHTLQLLERLCHRRAAGQVLGLYYLSNMPVPYARLLETRFDFFSWLDGGLFSGDVQLIKPDPAIYQMLQGRYALNPANTLFVDDLKTNVLAAQALGWQGHHFESPLQLEWQLVALGLL